MPFIIFKGETNGSKKTTTVEILEKKAYHRIRNCDSGDRIFVRYIYPVGAITINLTKKRSFGQ